MQKKILILLIVGLLAVGIYQTIIHRYTARAFDEKYEHIPSLSIDKDNHHWIIYRDADANTFGLVSYKKLEWMEPIGRFVDYTSKRSAEIDLGRIFQR